MCMHEIVGLISSTASSSPLEVSLLLNKDIKVILSY